MKILMIGNKESGKTTYMASAFGLLNDGVDNFHIDADQTTREWYQRLFKSIRSGGYPLASDKRESHRFKLKCLGKEVLDFEWIDYNGGIIRTIDADDLMNDIDTCDGVMLFFDSIALYKNESFKSQVRRILTLIAQKLTNFSDPLFTVILVVTKVDLLPSFDAFKQVSQPLLPFMENTQDNDKIYARIVPVSCSKLGFYNIELPLLDMLDSGMRTAYYKAQQQAKGEVEQFQNLWDSRSVGDWIFSKLNGLPTNGELAQRHLSAAQRQVDLFESIEEPMKKLREYVQSYEIIWPNSVSRSKDSGQGKRGRRLIRF